MAAEGGGRGPRAPDERPGGGRRGGRVQFHRLSTNLCTRETRRRRPDRKEEDEGEEEEEQTNEGKEEGEKEDNDEF